MKHSKRTSLSRRSRAQLSKVGSRSQLKRLQDVMATALFRPLTEGDRMQPQWIDNRGTSEVAESFIKPNDRLSSFERLEIYNRVYWFRVLDCLYDDYPGLRAVLGGPKFIKLITAYLAKYPSVSFTLPILAAASSNSSGKNRNGRPRMKKLLLIWFASNGLRLWPLMTKLSQASLRTMFSIPSQRNCGSPCNLTCHSCN